MKNRLDYSGIGLPLFKRWNCGCVTSVEKFPNVDHEPHRPTGRRAPPALRSSQGFVALLCLGLLPLAAATESFRIESLELAESGVQVQFVSHPGSYYILYRGSSVAEVGVPCALALGQSGSQVLTDAEPPKGSSFYRIRKVPLLVPGDTDGDGLDDTWELTRRDAAAAADGGDGDEDQTGNGISDRLDYLRERLRAGSAGGRRAIAAGSNHALALKADGSLWGWGNNFYGDCGLGFILDTNQPAQIGTSDRWISIAGGNQCSFGLQADGTLWSWGAYWYGQLGFPGVDHVRVPAQVGEDNDWAAVAASSTTSLSVGLRSDGTLWGWGDALGTLPILLDSASNWVAVSVGGGIINALKATGTLWQKDYAAAGWVPVGADSDWMAVSRGFPHALAIKRDGSLWAWTSPLDSTANVYGYLGVGHAATPTVPTRIGSDLDWIAASAGYYNSYGLKADGSLWAWGRTVAPELHPGTNVPVRVGTDSDWLAVDASILHVIALKADGTMAAWGNNTYGQLGRGTVGLVRSPERVGMDSHWTAVDAGEDFSLARDDEGQLWVWGDNRAGLLGLGTFQNTFVPVLLASSTPWLGVSASTGHVAAVKTDGSLWTWGVNDSGQLGDGTTIPAGAPQRIGLDTDWAQVSAGGKHTLALKRNGTLWAWGSNQNWQYGDLSTVGTNQPKQLFTLSPAENSRWKQIAAGPLHSWGVLSNGTLYAWGRSPYGSRTLDILYLRPEPMAGAWNSITTGRFNSQGLPYFHSLGVNQDGTLGAWGYNISGQLGDGTYTDPTSRTQAGSDHDWSAATVGRFHSVALKSDGSLWSWGSDFRGQAGTGARTGRASPGQIDNDKDWIAVAAGASHTLAVKSDGTLWAWGDNASGQAGQPTSWSSASVLGSDWGLPRPQPADQ